MNQPGEALLAALAKHVNETFCKYDASVVGELLDTFAAPVAGEGLPFGRDADAEGLPDALAAEHQGLDDEDWSAIENCLVACAHDPREKSNYAEWYENVLTKVRRLRLAANQPVAASDG